MRQFILVVLLVGAAFGGGAFVNGPALQWAQTRVLRSLGLNDSGEISSVELKPVPNSATGSDDTGLVKPEREATPGPVAPMPSLLSEHESPQDDALDRSSRSKTRPQADRSGPFSRHPEPSSSAAPLEEPLARVRPPLEPPAADPDVKPVSSPSPRMSTLPDSDVAPAILDTLARLLPANPPSSGSSTPPPSPPPESIEPARKSVAPGNEDWVILERKMQSMGISRYTVEGVPGGRVLFSCLIPIAGRQAITQRFEAEGDDLAQAARAALRRIALWRATQPSSQ